MLKIRMIFSTGTVLGTVLSSSLLSSTVHASQNVADLVPDDWKQIQRSVEVRQKMYSANLYGDPAEIQVMFQHNGSPALFDITELSANSGVDSNGNNEFSCQLPAGEDLGDLDPSYTEICSFAPKLLLKPGSGIEVETLQEYWMRVKFKNATGRSVMLRHRQPISPHCDGSVDPTSPAYGALDRLGSCGTVTSTRSFSDNNIHKPRLSWEGQVWTPLVLKKQTYRVTLDVSGGRVQVKNGLKLKVSGSLHADPNDELLEGAEFLGDCKFENNIILPTGKHSCEFVAGDDGFVHIPLKRYGSGSRQVKTTIVNLTQAGSGI